MKRSGKPLGSKISSLGRGDDKNLERADSYIRFVFYKPGTYFLDNVELKEASAEDKGEEGNGILCQAEEEKPDAESVPGDQNPYCNSAGMVQSEPSLFCSAVLSLFSIGLCDGSMTIRVIECVHHSS